MLSLDDDGSIAVSKLGSQNPKATLTFKTSRAYLYQMTFSEDEKWLAGNGEDGNLYVIDLRAFPALARFTFPLPSSKENSYRVTFDPLSRWLFVGSPEGQLYSWRLGDRLPTNAVPMLAAAAPPPSPLNERGLFPRIVISPDGRWAAVSSMTHGFFIWQLDQKTFSIMEPVLPREATFSAFEFSPKSDWIVGRTFLGSLYAWKPGSKPKLSKRKSIDENATRLRWCRDDKHFFSVGFEKLILSDVEESKPEEEVANPGLFFRFCLTLDHKRVVIFRRGRILLIERELSYWGVPIHTFSLPWLDERSGEGLF